MAAGRSQTFASADRDSGTSNAEITVFKKVSGNVTDSLTLTNPGTAGSLTYKYVGAGFWQRTTETAATSSGTIDSFAYGVTTPDAAMPRAGSASYAIDLLGTSSFSDSLTSLRGSGTMTVDFTVNNLNFSGTYTQVVVSTGVATSGFNFSGAAGISASQNGFAGTISLFNVYNGPLNGRFYGPAADEVGAVYHFTTLPGVAGTGTITGRRTTAIGTTDLTNITGTPVFGVNGTYSGYTIDSAGNSAGIRAGLGDVQNLQSYVLNADTGQRTVSDGNGQSATFQAVDRVAGESGATITTYRIIGGTKTDTLVLYNPGPGNPQLALSYASFGYWQHQQPNIAAGKTDIDTRFFSYGLTTPSGVVPLSGTASYTGILFGQAVSRDGGGPQYELGGTGHIDLNFGAQTLSGVFSPTLTSLADHTMGAWTTLNLDGLSQPANPIFSGFVSHSGDAGGQLRGALYGPHGEEAAATFYFYGSYGSVGQIAVTGAFVGKKN